MSGPLHSALYSGRVRHRRWQPRAHAFSYRLSMLYLDLDELDDVFRDRWLWSTRRPAPGWFRRTDHFGDPDRPLADCVREHVEQATGRRPAGPIRLLTQPRYFGYAINPISIYYCFDADDRTVETLVAEVTNTPWGERRCYVLHDGLQGGRDSAGRHRYRFRKTLHVSPFMPMDLDYRWCGYEPGPRLGVHLEVLRDGDTLFDATLNLRRRPLNGPNLARVLANWPPMTFRTVGAIYWQALRLWLKGTPFHAHPVDVKPAENRT